MKYNNIDFFIIGGQKCATTWLYHCLKDHPEIEIGGRKNEKNYFGGELFYKYGEKWFWSLFPYNNSEKIIGHASINYFYDDQSPHILYNNFPNSKIILSLRDPVDRAISAANWYARLNIVKESNLDKILEISINDFKNKKESIYSKIIDYGFYSNRLDLYTDLYKNQVLVLLYDEIKNKQFGVLKKLYSFLGLNKIDYIPLSAYRKPKVSIYNKSLVMFEKKIKKIPFLEKSFRLNLELISKIISIKNNKKIKPEIFHTLKSIYDKDISLLVKKKIFSENSDSINILKQWIK